jgi:hypothetical protein
MHLKSLFLYIVLFFILNCPQRLEAQSGDALNDTLLTKVETVLSSFEKGILHGTIEEFFVYFGSEIYLSFHNGITGSFSSNQSFFLLKDFFNDYIPVKFTYSKKVTDSEFPYGIGTLYYNRKGVKGILQVFISLTLESGNCKISQITID